MKPHRSVSVTVTSATEQTTYEGDFGIVFWVQTDRAGQAPPARVFLSADRADQVDGIDLTIGSALSVEGVLRADGVVVASKLRQAPDPLTPPGRLLGTVEIPVPRLARLDPRREQRYRLTLWGGIALVIGLAVCGMVWKAPLGNASFIVFLVLCAWLVWNDLHNRRVDKREYAALSQLAVETIESRLQVAVPPEVVFGALGGGLERTGNPWRPTRPRSPGTAYWLEGGHRARFAVTVTPQPLRPGATATLTVLTAGQDDPAPG